MWYKSGLLLSLKTIAMFEYFPIITATIPKYRLFINMPAIRVERMLLAYRMCVIAFHYKYQHVSLVVYNIKTT